MREIFNKINKAYNKDLVTPFWKSKAKIIEKAMMILYETIIIDDPDSNKLFDKNKLNYKKHIKRYEEKTLNKISDMHYFVEWGGGYGGMAELIYNMHCTYIIIDLPIMSYLQYVYLKSIGYNINIISEDNYDIKKNMINIVSLSFIDKINFQCDMFISTWGISESGIVSLKFVKKHDLFKSKYLLLAYQAYNSDEFPYANLRIKRTKRVKIDDNNKYIFR